MSKVWLLLLLTLSILNEIQCHFHYKLERNLTNVKHIWILPGGPGHPAENYAHLVHHYASWLPNVILNIHIMSYPGTKGSDFILSSASSLYETAKSVNVILDDKSDFDPESLSITKAALMVIREILEIKQSSHSEHHIHAISFGCVWALRLLQLAPLDLLHGVILDSASEMLPTFNEGVVKSSMEASFELVNNCQRHEECKQRIPHSTLFLQLFSQLPSLDNRNDSLMNGCVEELSGFASLQQTTVRDFLQFVILSALISSNHGKDQDRRVFALALTWHAIYCPSISHFRQLFTQWLEINPTAVGVQSSSISSLSLHSNHLNFMVYGVVVFSELWRHDLTLESVMNSFSSTSLAFNIAGLHEQYLSKGAFPRYHARRRYSVPEQLHARILFLNGALDAQSSVSKASKLFHFIQGRKKHMITWQNLGHGLSRDSTPCLRDVFNDYFMRDMEFSQSTQNCILSENNQTLFWSTGRSLQEQSQNKASMHHHLWGPLHEDYSDNSSHQEQQLSNVPMSLDQPVIAFCIAAGVISCTISLCILYTYLRRVRKV